MTLLKALTGTLICNYKDIEQEIVHTLLMEEYGVSKTWVIIMDKGQDKNAASTPIEIRTFGSGSLLCQEFRRRREETAWKFETNKDRSSSCDIYVTRDDVRCFYIYIMLFLHIYLCYTWWRALFLINCFWIEWVLYDCYLTRFHLTTGLLFDTFFIPGFNKVCRCDRWVFESQSFSVPINR